MAGRSVRIAVDAGILFLRFDRPPVNAIDLEFVREWEKTLAEVEGKGEACALVVTGAGSCFSAGLDLKVVPTYGAEEQAEMIGRINRALACLYDLPIPTVAAVNGHAIAAGLVVALACDYRIGSEAPCHIGLPEARAGIPFPAAAMAVVRAELAPAAARRLTLAARNYGPREALADGILDEIQAPEALLARATAVAADLAAIPRETYGRVKHQLRAVTLSTCRRIAETGADPLADTWLNPETRAASAGLLRR